MNDLNNENDFSNNDDNEFNQHFDEDGNTSGFGTKSPFHDHTTEKKIEEALKEINLSRKMAKQEGLPRYYYVLIKKIIAHCFTLLSLNRYRPVSRWTRRSYHQLKHLLDENDFRAASLMGISCFQRALALKKGKGNKKKMGQYLNQSLKFYEQALSSPELTYEDRITIEQHDILTVLEYATFLYQKRHTVSTALAVLSKYSPKDITLGRHTPGAAEQFRFNYYTILFKCLKEVRDYDAIRQGFFDYLDFLKELPSYGFDICRQFKKLADAAIAAAVAQKDWAGASDLALKAMEFGFSLLEDEKLGKSIVSSLCQLDNIPSQYKSLLTPEFFSFAMKKANYRVYYNYALQSAEFNIKAGAYQEASAQLTFMEYLEGVMIALEDSDQIPEEGIQPKSKGPGGRRLYLLGLCDYCQKQYDNATKNLSWALAKEVAFTGALWDYDIQFSLIAEIEKLLGDSFFEQGELIPCVSHYISCISQYRNRKGLTGKKNIIQHAKALLSLGHFLSTGKSKSEPIIWFQSAGELLTAHLEENENDYWYLMAITCAECIQYWNNRTPQSPLYRIYASQWANKLKQMMNLLHTDEYDLSEWPDWLVPINEMEALVANLNAAVQKDVLEYGAVEVPPPKEFDPATAGKITNPLTKNEEERYLRYMSNAEFFDFMIITGRATKGEADPPTINCFPDDCPWGITKSAPKGGYQDFVASLFEGLEESNTPPPPMSLLKNMLTLKFGQPRKALQHKANELFPNKDSYPNSKDKIESLIEFVDSLKSNPTFADEYLKDKD